MMKTLNIPLGDHVQSQLHLLLCTLNFDGNHVPLPMIWEDGYSPCGTLVRINELTHMYRIVQLSQQLGICKYQLYSSTLAFASLILSMILVASWMSWMRTESVSTVRFSVDLMEKFDLVCGPIQFANRIVERNVYKLRYHCISEQFSHTHYPE